MSLYIGETGRKIVKYCISHPRLGRTADVIGQAAERLTRGHYRTGLTRSAFILSRSVKAGELVTIDSGQVVAGGRTLLKNERLFANITAKDVTVTPDMETPEGMTSFLRWEAIGNMPGLLTSAFHLMSNAAWLLYTLPAYLGLQDNWQDLTVLQRFTLALTSLTFIPYYRALSLLVPKAEKTTQLSLRQVEQQAVKIADFHGPTAVGSYFRSVPGVVFLNSRKSPALKFFECFLGSTQAHETAHALGASEIEAYRLGAEKTVKDSFGGSRPRPLALLLFAYRTFILNIVAAVELLRGNNIFRGIFGPGSLRRSMAKYETGNDRNDLLAAIEALEGYSYYGEIDRKIKCYQHIISILNDQPVEESSTFLPKIYFGYGLALKESGDIPGAKKALQDCLDLGQTNKTIYSAAEIELARISTIRPFSLASYSS